MPSPTVEKKQSKLGVGPSIALSAFVYAALAGAATNRWPGAFLLRSVPYAAFLIAGVLLLLLGTALLVFAIASMTRGYSRDQLVTLGVFALCRHPWYAAWIVLIIPGITLLTRSWLLMITPLVAYTTFKLAIHEEDNYLRLRFGAAYLEYRATVTELIPRPRLWHHLQPRSAIAKPLLSEADYGANESND
jgi:protein-S-isoprenylcysteine O-methyltransferase Ste14